MYLSFAVFDSHHKCACPFDRQTCADPVNLLALIDERQIFEKVRRVGHAKGGMVVDADLEGIGIKSEVGVGGWTHIA